MESFSLYIFYTLLSFQYGSVAKEQETAAQRLSSDMDALVSNLSDMLQESGGKPVEEAPESEPGQLPQNQMGQAYQDAMQQGREIAKKEYRNYQKHVDNGLEFFTIAVEELKRFWYTGQCRRNYHVACPAGWTLEDTLCKAPVNYNGPCQHFKDFTKMDAVEREEYAWRCQADWPCVDARPIDDGTSCPMGWVNINSMCIAPMNYHGICPPIWSFRDLDLGNRVSLESQCDFKWPFVPIQTKGPTTKAQQYSQPLNKSHGIITETGHLLSM